MGYNDGWIAHALPYTTPPTMTALSYFGLNIEDKTPPITTPFEQMVEEITSYGVYYPSLEAGDNPNDKISTKFIPVNGIFNNWFFGKVSDNAGIKTVVNMDGLSRKPRIATWQQSGSKKYHHYANVFGNLDMSWEKNRLMVSMFGKGQDHGESALTPTYTYPSGISSQFTHINLCTWNAVDLYPTRLRFVGSQNLTPIPGSNGKYQAINEFDTQFGIYNIQFISASGEAIWDDFLAKEKREFIWRIIKSVDNTKYMKYTQNAMILSLIPTRVLGQSTVWSAVFKIENVSAEINDGVANSFYGL